MGFDLECWLASKDRLLHLGEHIALWNIDVLERYWQLDLILAVDEAILRKNCLVRFLNKWLGDLLTRLDVSRSCHEESLLSVLLLPSGLNARCSALVEKVDHRDQSVELSFFISEGELSGIDQLVKSLELLFWVPSSEVVDT